jgi:hypothetical protein
MRETRKKTITVIVSDGGITQVTGVPEGIELKIIDRDWERPQVHIYKKGGKDIHREATDAEAKAVADNTQS